VAAAAVILPHRCKIKGLNDSKLLSPAVREQFSERLKGEAVAWAVGWASVAEIEELNILQASRLAMLRAVNALIPQPDYLLIDAVRIESPIPQQPIIHGDAISCSIAAASILAKVERDRLLERFHRRYPSYMLNSNKGYGTRAHLAALHLYGPTPQHRASFAPVRGIIESRRANP